MSKNHSNTLEMFRNFVRNINRAQNICVLENDEVRIDVFQYTYTEKVYVIRDRVNRTVTLLSNFKTVTINY